MERPLSLPASVTVDPLCYCDWVYSFYRGRLEKAPSSEEVFIHYYAYVELAEMGEQEAGREALRSILPRRKGVSLV